MKRYLLGCNRIPDSLFVLGFFLKKESKRLGELEEKLEKAEQIADIAMQNMPVDKYGFYTLLEPYISAYYEVGNKEKARQLFKDVAVKYQEYLKYYGSLTIKNQEENFTEILTNIERYKALVDVLTNYDSNFAKKESITFESYLQLFKHFYQDEPSSQEVTPLTEEDFLKEFDTVLKGE